MKLQILKSLLLMCSAVSAQLLFGNDIDTIKSNKHSYHAANDYIKEVLKIENQRQIITKDGKDIFVVVGYADRLLIKDFPDDIETIKIIYFISLKNKHINDILFHRILKTMEQS